MSGRTFDELAAAASHARPEVLLEILEDEERRGHVERVGGRWRLTAAAEARFGRALRELLPTPKEGT